MGCAIPRRADDVSERQARRSGPRGHFVPGATAQMLDWFKGTARESGGFHGYYRTLAEELLDPRKVKPASLSASASMERILAGAVAAPTAELCRTFAAFQLKGTARSHRRQRRLAKPEVGIEYLKGAGCRVVREEPPRSIL